MICKIDTTLIPISNLSAVLIWRNNEKNCLYSFIPYLIMKLSLFLTQS